MRPISVLPSKTRVSLERWRAETLRPWRTRRKTGRRSRRMPGSWKIGDIAPRTRESSLRRLPMPAGSCRRARPRPGAALLRTPAAPWTRPPRGEVLLLRSAADSDDSRIGTIRRNSVQTQSIRGVAASACSAPSECSVRLRRILARGSSLHSSPAALHEAAAPSGSPRETSWRLRAFARLAGRERAP